MFSIFEMISPIVSGKENWGVNFIVSRNIELSDTILALVMEVSGCSISAEERQVALISCSISASLVGTPEPILIVPQYSEKTILHSAVATSRTSI